MGKLKPLHCEVDFERWKGHFDPSTHFDSTQDRFTIYNLRFAGRMGVEIGGAADRRKRTSNVE